MANGQKLTDLYIEYADGVTDAPRVYAQWMGYLILSSVINKSVYMRSAIQKIYPNFYFLVIGPSSVCRKSFSQKLAWRFIKEIHPDLRIMDISSRETFISEYAREDRTPNGCALLLVDEMAGFLTRIKRNSNFYGMLQDLSSIFDGDDLYRRKGVEEKTKEIFRIDEPFLNFSGACSFDWLTKSIETSDLTGGFLARFILVVSNDRNPNPWSEEKQGDDLLRHMILERLRQIQSLIGEIKWSPAAKKMWDAWYSDFRTRNQGGQWDANYERLTLQVRKIAMLNAVQELRLEISDTDLDDAICLAEPLVHNLSQIVIGDDKDEIMRNRIYAYIRRHAAKPITRSQLLNGVSGLDAWALSQHEKTLIEMEKIEIVVNGDGKRKKTYYKIKTDGAVVERPSVLSGNY